MASQWFNRHYKRLKAEQIIMKERFPQFVLKKDAYGRVFWKGILLTNFGTNYHVQIIYPDSYPYQRPVFKILWPNIKKDSPHLYNDGSICVYPNQWVHSRCTAPAGVPLIASWLAMYEIWLKTGRRW